MIAPTKPILLPNGGRLHHGQITGVEIMKSNPQRKLNSALPRNGAPKNITDAPIKPGMKRTTSGEPAAYHHGVSVGDEPNAVKSFTNPAPLHPATPARIADKVGASNDASTVLAEAARLGRKA